MKNSPRNKDDTKSLSPSPSNIMTITKTTSPRPYITRTESITLLGVDSSSLPQIVEMLTGPSVNPNSPLPPRFLLPPLRPVHNKNQSSSSSSSLYQRRSNSKKHLKINPVRSGLTERVSPSVINFKSLVLTSPDTPLVHDPFTPRPSAGDSDVEEREIREKGFYLHPSPSSTPTDPKPQLLVLFPLTSPRASESPASSTQGRSGA